MYIRNFLPNFLKKRLWGDRKKYGLRRNQKDPIWEEYNKIITEFYESNQRGGIGGRVNDLGYDVLNKVNLRNKNILEIGAGDIRHLTYWKDEKPKKYIIADVSNEMMQISEKKLIGSSITYEKLLISRNEKIPLDNDSIDIVISFYSLEHIYPLDDYLQDISRILKKNGKIIGAIPAEGGIAWGLGRYLTSRRWFKKNTNINPDKLICWEHPNFSDFIIKKLDSYYKKIYLSYEPFKVPLIDTNLVLKFIYSKV